MISTTLRREASQRWRTKASSSSSGRRTVAHHGSAHRSVCTVASIFFARSACCARFPSCVAAAAADDFLRGLLLSPGLSREGFVTIARDARGEDSRDEPFARVG